MTALTTVTVEMKELSMAVELSGRDGARFNQPTWSYLMKIAYAFGWELSEASTSKWRVCEKSGSLLELLSRNITGPDARALADALFTAVKYVKKRRPLTERQASALYNVDFRRVMELAEYALGGGFSVDFRSE